MEPFRVKQGVNRKEKRELAKWNRKSKRGSNFMKPKKRK